MWGSTTLGCWNLVCSILGCYKKYYTGILKILMFWQVLAILGGSKSDFWSKMAKIKHRLPRNGRKMNIFKIAAYTLIVTPKWCYINVPNLGIPSVLDLHIFVILCENWSFFLQREISYIFCTPRITKSVIKWEPLRIPCKFTVTRKFNLQVGKILGVTFVKKNFCQKKNSNFFRIILWYYFMVFNYSSHDILYKEKLTLVA